MKRTSNNKSQPGDSAEHSDDEVSEERPRDAVDTSTTLPDVNHLISEDTRNYLQRQARKYNSVDKAARILSDAFEEVVIDPQWCEILTADFINATSCRDFVTSNGVKLIIASAQNQDYTELFSERGGLRKSQPTIGNENQLVEVQESMAATESSWIAEFQGSSTDALFNYMCKDFKNKNLYARHCAIVQSSGMGKSRLVDELSKKHLVIPFCLRKEGTNGFPPADTEVRNFLLSSETSDQAFKNSSAFLTAIGYELLEWLKKKNFSTFSCSLEQVAREFRTYMTEGMNSTSHNANRVTFYKNAIERARDLVSRKGTIPRVATNAVKGIEESPPQIFVDPDLDAETTPTNPSSGVDATTILEKVVEKLTLGSKSILPIIIFAYDEAHTLTVPLNKETKVTHFNELRRAIRSIRSVDAFSLFLSTTGKIFQFGGSSSQDPSSRIQSGSLRLLYPFSDLSFDLFASSPLPGATLESFAGIDYIVTFGRPLFYTRFKYGNNNVRDNIIRFAAEKLLGIDPDTISQQHLDITRPQSLACLSVRLDLNFQPRNPDPEVELAQIENHMRVCLEVNDSFDRVESVAASEPLLAEAAAGVMMSGLFNPVKALSSEFRRPQIERGERSEVVVALMQLLVRDKLLAAQQNGSEDPAYSIHVDRTTKVVDFLQEFFADSKVVEDATPSVRPTKRKRTNRTPPIKTFSKMFANSRCYFSHFIKVTQHKQVKQKLLFGLALRGASVICANCMPGVDIITPFFYRDAKAKKEVLSVILWQCKNDRKYGITPKEELFDAMDPYRLRIFDFKEPPPIIRIVTALAASPSDDAGLVNVSSRPSGGSSFTSYDFWAYGFHESLYKVLGYPVNEGGGDSEWTTLLDVSVASTVFRKKDRNTDEMIAIRRRQHPGRSAEEGHYSWCKELL